MIPGQAYRSNNPGSLLSLSTQNPPKNNNKKKKEEEKEEVKWKLINVYEQHRQETTRKGRA